MNNVMILARNRNRSRSSRRLQFDSLEKREVLSTYVVSPLGKDTNPGTAALPFATLQHAANLVQPGDTVDVKAGKYVGFVMGWNSPQSGAPGKQITFSAEPGVTINTRNSKTADGIDLEYSSYITIEGFNVDGMGRAGIRAVQDTGIVIENNDCDQNNEWGIYTSFSNNVLIQDNTASRSVTQHGIYVANTCSGAEVLSNYLWGNANCGLEFNGGLADGGTGLATNATVEGNFIVDNGATGGAAINCDGLQNSIIANNILIGNESSGIALFQSDAAAGSKNNIIANNTIVMASNARWAININTGSTGNQVLNNILYDENTSHGAITITSDSLAGFVSNHNLVAPEFNLNGTNLKLAAWQSQNGQDKQSVVATIAQTFVQPTLTTSAAVLTTGPAYDTGINLSQYFTTNAFGAARSAKGAWNIGAD